MSAHVVAKPKPFTEDDEKTTTDEQWGDEASTTVEQEEAEKLRGLAADMPRRANVDAADADSQLDESTVEEARDSSAIASMAQQPRTTPAVARLIATQGNDSGQELAIFADKRYTVGRAVDNDFVLTDIAVSRKHFDLCNEGGAWVIIDRGSGNGTVVNGNLEDNPFMLANGDLIEIGNTVFRFEANGAARVRPRELEVDDDELSTVAGKISAADLATPVEAPLPDLSPRQNPRPKTLPPATPLRPAPGSSPPVFSVGPQSPASMPTQLELRGPNGAPVHPSALPTTIPGQGPAAAFGGSYPLQDLGAHPQVQNVAANGRRADPSTALVAPTPFVPVLAQPSMPRFVPPQLSRRTKMILSASGAGLLLVVIALAVFKPGSSTTSADQAAPTGSATASSPTTGAPPGKSDGSSSSPSVTSVQPARVAPTPAAKDSSPPAPRSATPVPPPAPPTAPPATSRIATPMSATTQRSEPRGGDGGKSTQVTTTSSSATTSSRTTSSSKGERPRTETARTDKETAKTDKETAKTDKETAKTEKRPKRDSSASSGGGSTQSSTNLAVSAPPSRKVATIDPSDARRQADAAYSAKRFNEAASLLAGAARTAAEGDAQQLRHRADLVASFGRYYSAGTAPAASAVEQFEKLRQAENYDSSLGNVFNGDIETRLQQIASKAAISYMANKLYDRALAAVEKAESLGVSDGNVKAVRTALDSKASDLYNDAKAEADSNPADAKDKLRKMLQMIDTKSPYYARGKQLQSKLGN